MDTVCSLITVKLTLGTVSTRIYHINLSLKHVGTVCRGARESVKGSGEIVYSHNKSIKYWEHFAVTFALVQGILPLETLALSAVSLHGVKLEYTKYI